MEAVQYPRKCLGMVPGLYGRYPSGNVTHSKEPNSRSERIMRGGHWQADAAGCRSTGRWRFPPNLASDAVGFRLVMVP